jgi:hypothetical protein
VNAPLRAAQVRANKRGISFGELVLEVLEQRLADDLSDRARDPLFLDDATFSDSWADDLAERHDADLYDEPAA